MIHSVKIEEFDRQIILLALAELSIAKSGWLYAAERAALTMDETDNEGRPKLFEAFRLIHTQPVIDALVKGALPVDKT